MIQGPKKQFELVGRACRKSCRQGTTDKTAMILPITLEVFEPLLPIFHGVKDIYKSIVLSLSTDFPLLTGTMRASVILISETYDDCTFVSLYFVCSIYYLFTIKS